MIALASRLGILFMRAIAPLPLPVLRAMGTALGAFLFVVVVPRRRIATRNLELCFPQWTAAERRRVVRRHFVRFAQAWLDRSWLWHGRPEVVASRLALAGATHELEGGEPTILFVPHFLGLDAGVTGVTMSTARRVTGVYTRQSNPVVDAWILKGRYRFGNAKPMLRADGVRDMIADVRDGGILFLLPDMNFGVQDSVWVPFYGVAAATLPSLSRFSRLCRAKVVPLLARLTDAGYQLEVLPAWQDYPSGDAVADTALMNRRLEGYIDTMPEQYYWVHKRFKSRPPGEPPVY